MGLLVRTYDIFVSKLLLPLLYRLPQSLSTSLGSSVKQHAGALYHYCRQQLSPVQQAAKCCCTGKDKRPTQPAKQQHKITSVCALITGDDRVIRNGFDIIAKSQNHRVL